MKSTILRRGLSIVYLSLLVSPISFSISSEEENQTLEEIVVTARKRQESLQDTPVAVTAFTGDELDQKGITNLVDLSGFAPNLNIGTSGFAGAGNYSSAITIRGLTQTEFLPHLDPAVGIYIDGVYFGRSVGSAMELVDLERVEILRGPQGTLFGKNTIGGAINLVSKKPLGDGSGYVDLILGSGDRHDVRGTFDVSLSDNVSAKFSVSSQQGGDWGKALDYATKAKVADLGGKNGTSYRAAFSFQASENTTVDLTYDSTDRDDPQSVNGLVFLDPAAGAGLGGLWLALVGIPSGQPLLPGYISGDPDVTYSSTLPNELEVTGTNLTITSEQSWGTFKSITSKRDMDAKFGRDGDGPVLFSQTYDINNQDQTSQEFQFSGENGNLSWIVGAFYFDESYYDHNDVYQGPGMYQVLEMIPVQLPGFPCAPPWLAPGCPGNPINVALDIQIDVTNKVDTESTAFYSQFTYAMSDKLNLTAGVRVTEEEKTVFANHYKPASKSTIVNMTQSEDWSETSTMFSVDYQVNEDLMAYVSFSEGFRSGGFNPRPVGAFTMAPFGPENVDTLEIGFKSEFSDRRVRLNGAFFSSDYKDLQYSINRFNPTTGTVELLVGNAAEAEIDGYELELQALLSENFSMQASLGNTDFEITKLYPGTSAEISLNTKNAYTPENNSALSLIYSSPVENGVSTFRVDYTHQDESFVDMLNTPQLEIDAHDMINARWSLESSKGWTIALFGTNLSDERVIVGGTSNINSFGHAEATYSRPREYGVSIRMDF